MNDKEYICDEIRDKFQVSSIRKKVWLCELKIAQWFCTVCSKYNLSYFLIGGSAIGAVRHNGFIPWDDDLDIGMLRNNFETFKEVAPKELPDEYYIEYGVLSDNIFSSLLRIRNKNTTGILVDVFWQGSEGGGIFIEIYPFDNTIGGVSRKIQLLKSSMFFLALNNWNRKNDFRGTKRLIISILRLFPISFIWVLYEKNNKKYNNYGTDYVDTIALPSYAKLGIHYYLLSDVIETVAHEYEFIKLNIPIGNDRCLRQQYGEYMRLPPIEQRGIHHDFIVFYDPDKPYSDYKNSSILKRYFDGDVSLELL